MPHRTGSLPAAAEPLHAALIRLHGREFARIQRLVYHHFGIRLGPAKREAVEGRLQLLLRETGFDSFGHYCDHLEADSSGRALSELFNRISTHHTYFFREEGHFDFLLDRALPPMLEALQRAGEPDVRLWSAGCSSGEEPYMLAMLLMEHLGPAYRQWHAGVLATDVSAEALARAEAAVYPEERLRLVPPAIRAKYFEPAGPEHWRVAEHVRREVVFRRFNLRTTVLPFRRPFHVIFCRNVMIYFDDEVRQKLVCRFYEHTVPGGYLFVGHSETLRGLRHPWHYVQPAVYRKPPH